MADEAGLASPMNSIGERSTLSCDAFLERVVQLLDPRRHLGLRAAVDDRDVAAEPPGGAGRVHRGVAAADDEHFLAVGLRQRRLVIVVDGACIRLTRVRNSLADITLSRCSPGTFMKRGRPAPVPTKIFQKPAAFRSSSVAVLPTTKLRDEPAAQAA